MKTLDLLLVAIILLSFSPCAIELFRFTAPMNWKIVQGTILSTHTSTYFGRRRGFTTLTVNYQYKGDDGILRHDSATSIPSWTGSGRLNAPFTDGSTVLVEYNPSNPNSSVCSGIGWAFGSEHLFDGFIISILAAITLTLKGITGRPETIAQQNLQMNRRDSYFSS